MVSGIGYGELEGCTVKPRRFFFWFSASKTSHFVFVALFFIFFSFLKVIDYRLCT